MSQLCARLISWLRGAYMLLHRPTIVLRLCLLMAFVNLVLDASLFQYMSLRMDSKNIQAQIIQHHKELLSLRRQIILAKEPYFIEIKAIDTFNLAAPNHLVYVFTQ